MGTERLPRARSRSRLSRLWLLATATGMNAIYVLALQVLALTSLESAEFAVYSIQYLAYAFSASLCLSIVSEAWLRSSTDSSQRAPWTDYSGMVVYLALAAGFVTLMGSLLLPALRDVALLGGLAVTASTYRAGARYFAVSVGQARYVLLPDLLALATTVGAWTLANHFEMNSLTSMIGAWTIGSVVAALSSRLPSPRPPSVVRTWVATHRAHIGPLLRESLLLDLGAIGTPYILAPILGLASFGTYRAVSNISAPVRLVLTPLRPTLAARPLAKHRSVSALGTSLAVATVFGLGAFAFLDLIGALGADLGTLNDLAPFALPTGIYVAANFIGHYYYIVARGHLSGRSLMTGRLIQTVLVTGLPVGFALRGGLNEVIWSFTFATVAWAATWVVLVTKATEPGVRARVEASQASPQSNAGSEFPTSAERGAR